MTEIVVGADENRRHIGVATGDSLRIVLPEHRVGFRWQVEPSSLQGVSALRLQSVDHLSEGGKASSRLRVFRFSAETPGQATLRLELAPAWNGETASETFIITVDVR